MAELNIIGEPFQRRIHRANRKGENKWFARYRCECGNEFESSVANIKSEKTKSCGCKSSRHKIGELNATHGMSGTRTYDIWCGMRKRCNDPSCTKFANYGGRGIAVCERWNSFEDFFSDMGECPSVKHSLDRFPNQNGNYEPGNCRWATAKEQANNMRSNRILVIGGIAKTMANWSRDSAVSYRAIQLRLKRGWTPEEAVFGKATP